MKVDPSQHPHEASTSPVGPVWLYRMFHEPTTASYQIIHTILNLVIFVAAITGALETVDSIQDRFQGWFYICEVIITFIFTLEYIGHVMTIRRKRDYIFSFWG